MTVEQVVDDLRPWSHLVRIPAHRVLAVVEAPLGAHPGGLYTGDLPVDGYGEDYDFWVDARAATTRATTTTRGSASGCSTSRRRSNGWTGSAPSASSACAPKPRPTRGTSTRRSTRPDLDAPVNAWERAAVWGARYLADRVAEINADAVLAGAGVANLSAWLGVQLARAAGCEVQLTAEIGLWGYDATPADPFVLNHRNFPTATMLSDAQTVLGALVGGAGTTTIGCLGGAQIDRNGNVNSTWIPAAPFLVGSGGGNDVASTADECIVVATLTPPRTPERCGYMTSPGRAMRALVTDLGVLEKQDGVARADGGPGERRTARRPDRGRARRVRLGPRRRGRGRRVAAADGRRDRDPAPLGPPRLVPARVVFGPHGPSRPRPCDQALR